MKKSIILENLSVAAVLTGAALFLTGSIFAIFDVVRVWGFCVISACLVFVLSLAFMMFADTAHEKERQQENARK